MSGITLPVEIVPTYSNKKESLWVITCNETDVGQISLSEFILPRFLTVSISFSDNSPDLEKFVLTTVVQTLLREPLYRPVLEIGSNKIEDILAMFNRGTIIAHVSKENSGDEKSKFFVNVSDTLPSTILYHQRPIYNTLSRFLSVNSN